MVWLWIIVGLVYCVVTMALPFFIIAIVRGGGEYEIHPHGETIMWGGLIFGPIPLFCLALCIWAIIGTPRRIDGPPPEDKNAERYKALFSRPLKENESPRERHEQALKETLNNIRKEIENG